MKSGDKLPVALALLLLLAAALLFIRLGTPEIQPWDEGLYVVRADGIARFGGWLDQTEHALGGLYSATHPPVAIWFMAGSELLFGRNEWAFGENSYIAMSTELQEVTGEARALDVPFYS